MFLLQIIGSVVLIFCLVSGLDPIDMCSDEYKEDFSCFFQINETQSDVKFCALNNFTCLVNHPNDFNQSCFHNQTNPENNWHCYTKDLKPMSYEIYKNVTDIMISENDIFFFIVTYEDESYPTPFSQLSFNSETYLKNLSGTCIEGYFFPVKNFGIYSLKIFQPAYQKYDEVFFNITQGHYYMHSKLNLNLNNEVENLLCFSFFSVMRDLILYLSIFLQTINHD